MTEQTVRLSPTIAQLEADFELSAEAKLGLSDEKLEAWVGKFRTLPASEQAQAFAETLAVAVKFRRVAPEETEQAVEQLLLLSSVLLGSVEDASDAFAKAGVTTKGLLTGESREEDRLPTEAPDKLWK